jgi:hypothetical protein
MTSTQADDKQPKMPDSWSGVVRDTALRSSAPEKGYVADEKTWKNLWSKWRGDQIEAPNIDFSKEIVIVATSNGPNQMYGKPRLIKDGAVIFTAAATLMAGPGFGYILARLPIEGVKSINNKPFTP